MIRLTCSLLRLNVFFVQCSTLHPVLSIQYSRVVKINLQQDADRLATMLHSRDDRTLTRWQTMRNVDKRYDFRRQ